MPPPAHAIAQPTDDVRGLLMIDGATSYWAPAHARNYTRGRTSPKYRAPRRILAIAMHTTEEAVNDVEAGVEWFRNPESGVSTHYVVSGPEGDLYQCVRDWDYAHAQGGPRRMPLPNWYREEYGSLNSCMLSIELEGYAATLGDTMAVGSAQWETLVRLTAYKCRQYGIPIHRDYIRGHNELTTDRDRFTGDPGRYFPYGELIRQAQRHVDDVHTVYELDGRTLTPAERDRFLDEGKKLEPRLSTADPQVRTGPTTPVSIEETRIALPEVQQQLTRTVARRQVLLERLAQVDILDAPPAQTGVRFDQRLRMQFTVKVGSESDARPWAVGIYNPTSETVEAVRERGRIVELRGAHGLDGDPLPLLARGQLARVAQVWEPPDVIMQLLVAEIGMDAANGWVSSSFINARARVVLEYLCDRAGLELGSLRASPRLARDVITVHFASDVRTAIDRVLDRYSLSYTVHAGVLTPVSASAQATGVVHQVSAESGMVGQPTIKDDGVLVRVRLSGAYSPGDQIDLRSVRVTGRFGVVGIEHNGDTRTGDFYTTLRTAYLET